jgi:hypothetical protein
MAGGQYECIGRVASLDDVEAARHGAAPAAAKLLGQVPAAEGRLLPALVAAVEALAERDGDRLEAVGGRLEELSCFLHAAELTAAAATVTAAQGLAAAAARLRTRAQQLVARRDGATTELLRSPVGDGLTTLNGRSPASRRVVSPTPRSPPGCRCPAARCRPTCTASTPS